MSASNLPPSLSTGQLHPAFARIFEGIFPQAIQQSLAPVRRSEAPVYCEYELPEFGGERCARVATVHHLEASMDCCLKHFEALL